MGCFFTCFRFRDADRLRRPLPESTPVSAKSAEKFVSKNQLASLFISEEDDSFCGSNSGHDGIDKELRREVKLLKACGAISETPIELQKTHKKTNVHTEVEGSGLRFGGSCKKLEWDEQTVDTGVFALQEDEANASACHPRRSFPGIWQSEGRKSNSLSFLLSDHQNIDSPCTVGSILLEDAKDNHTISSDLEDRGLNICTPQVDNDRDTDLIIESVSKIDPLNISTPQVFLDGKFPGRPNSPSSTPLKLSDEMQTPCTVYPANLQNLLLERNAQLRTQFVYPVAKPTSDVSLFNNASKNDELVKVEGVLPDQDRQAHLQHSEVSTSQPQNLKTSLQFLPDENPQCAAVKKVISECDRERPIIGTVAAHWNDDGLSRISPKWWDGNGIPNSTNKYKEDQRVSWHATPFEVRLEKALSEGNVCPERSDFCPANWKLNAKPINFEDDESDTAAS